MRHNANKSFELLQEQYTLQASSVNMFYRGTDYMFWNDFLNLGWGDFDLSKYVTDSAKHPNDLTSNEIRRTSAWTWVTGDQHLSNFGAWKNRAGVVVWGVNDFDEAVIFDFQMDVWRLAVSIYDHALSNDYTEEQAVSAIIAFTDSYVDTLVGYLGNERAQLFEMTANDATGKLKAFLSDTERANSAAGMLNKFTRVNEHGVREFIKNDKTRLGHVDARTRDAVMKAWTTEGYGATLNRVGWHEIEFSDEYFHVLDIATRVGSGDGSFGSMRLYLLITGGDRLKPDVPNVILDLKLAPEPAMRHTLSKADLAWYNTLFLNEGSRVSLAQRALSTFTDPYTGWIEVDDKILAVRQRSPYKESFDLDMLKNFSEFVEFVQQAAIVTATSHQRGTVGRSPANFKEVIASVLGDKKSRTAWGTKVAAIASGYRQQLVLDYQCFVDWVDLTFPSAAAAALKTGSQNHREL